MKENKECKFFILNFTFDWTAEGGEKTCQQSTN